MTNNLILYVLFHSHYTFNFSLNILFDNTYEYLLMKSGCYWELTWFILSKLEIKSPYTLLKLSYLEIREAEIKKFLHEYCQTLFLLIGKNKFAIGHFGQ